MFGGVGYISPATSRLRCRLPKFVMSACLVTGAAVAYSRHVAGRHPSAISHGPGGVLMSCRILSCPSCLVIGVAVTGAVCVPDVTFAIGGVLGEVLMSWSCSCSSSFGDVSSDVIVPSAWTADNQSMHAGAFSVFSFCLQSLTFDFIWTLSALAHFCLSSSV